MKATKDAPKFILVSMIPRQQSEAKTLADLEELESLVVTYGGVVHALSIQNFSKVKSATYIGIGKVKEVTQKIADHDIDVVVINDQIESDQLYNLSQSFVSANEEVLVWDRIDLILQIFSKHATTKEAKLQIKLAELQHQGPQLQGIGLTMSQQAGGIGTRGAGETSTETIKRHWRLEIRNLKRKLKKVTQNRQLQIDHRKKTGLPAVSIVGYTNAGKSTLFNALTQKDTLIEDALFATLDSSVGKFYLPQLKKEIFLSDTIGFIQNLPHELIDAFKSTLMEAIHADLVLHVIDVSDKRVDEKIKSVATILKDLNIDKKSLVYVFNKIDQVKDFDTKSIKEKYHQFHPQFISAKKKEGFEDLLQAISSYLPLR